MEINKYKAARFKILYILVVKFSDSLSITDYDGKEVLKKTALDFFELSKTKIISIEFKDHCMLIEFEGSPKEQVSKIVNSFKTVTSRKIRSFLKLERSAPFWCNDYLLISKGVPGENNIVQSYIEGNI